MSSTSPLFFFNDSRDMPVKSAGVVLRRVMNGRPQFLLQRRRYTNDGYWKPSWFSKHERDGLEYFDIVEDMGGHAEASDESIIAVMAREAVEESNGLLNAASLSDRLTHPDVRMYYSPLAKYAVAVIPATEEECFLSPEDFGDREANREWVIERRVEWMTARQIEQCGRALHLRLHRLNAFR